MKNKKISVSSRKNTVCACIEKQIFIFNTMGLPKMLSRISADFYAKK